MKYLDGEEILLIHDRLIELYGGSHGVRDIQRLKSVVNAPKQNVFGKELYETLFDKAAVYARNIILDHPFLDGNKRTGITAAAMFLAKNGVLLNVVEGHLEDMAVRIAIEKLEVKTISKWLRENSS